MSRQPTWRARLAQRLAVDGNQLLRRSDRVRAWLFPAAIIGWALLTPLAAGLAGGLVHQADLQQQLSQRSWRPAVAVLLQRAPGSDVPGMGQVYSWTPAKWTVGGRSHVGAVPAAAGTAKGKTVRIWLDNADRPRQPLSAVEVDHNVRLAEIAATLLLGLVLLACAGVIRACMTRCSLAAWGRAWRAVEPQWTRRRSAG